MTVSYVVPGYDRRLTARETRLLLCEAQNWRCCLCGDPMGEPEIARAWGEPVRPDDATIEHIQTKETGGRNLWENLAASHSRCNHQRGGRPGERRATIATADLPFLTAMRAAFDAAMQRRGA